MSLLLYLAAALLLLWIAHRALIPISKPAAIVLLLLPMCITGKALLTGGVFGPVDLPYFTEPLRDMRAPLGVAKPHNGMLSDLYAQMIPWRKAVQFAIAHGEWPLWNPFILSGTQLAAAAQPAAYSPFTLFACLLPVAHSITFSAALTFFWPDSARSFSRVSSAAVNRLRSAPRPAGCTPARWPSSSSGRSAARGRSFRSCSSPRGDACTRPESDPRRS